MIRPAARCGGAWLAIVLASCSTTIESSRTETSEFYGAVASDVAALVESLGALAADELAATLPGLEVRTTWQDVLDEFSERPRLDPLAEEIRDAIDRHADPGMRAQILAPGGNRRLRDLIVTTLENALAERNR